MRVSPSNFSDFMGCLLVDTGDQLGHPGYVREESSGPAECFTDESLICFYEDICFLSFKV